MDSELFFFYSNKIPFHWWNKETEYTQTMIKELKHPGDNLCAGYIELLKYWLSIKNLNF